MSPFSKPPHPIIGTDGREIPLRPLYELDNGALAAVELSFEDPFSQGEAKLEAIRDVLRKRSALFTPKGFLCVPMGARELHDAHFPETLAGICRAVGDHPAGLCLFFPDELCLERGLRSLDQLLRFKRLGFRLGIDIQNLDTMPGLFVERLPADVLRLSPLDTLALAEDPEAVRAVLDFTRYAANLLMLPAARGVRSRGQLGMLRDMGVRIGQGPLFSCADSPASQS